MDFSLEELSWIMYKYLAHSDGTHSLQRIQWRASDVMLYFSKSVLMMKLTLLHLG